MSEAPREDGKKPQWPPTERWSWGKGCFYVFLFIVLLGVILLLIKPVTYQMTHFNATDCGELARSATLVALSDKPNEVPGLQDIRCFVRAHQQCTAATLTMVEVGTDRGATLTFRTANGLGGCTLSVVGHGDGCPFPLLCAIFPYIDSDCRTMQQEQDGLHFLDCGNLPDIVFQI